MLSAPKTAFDAFQSKSSENHQNLSFSRSFRWVTFLYMSTTLLVQLLFEFVNVSFNISVLHVLKFEYLPVYLIKQVLKGSIGAQRANCLNRQKRTK